MLVYGDFSETVDPSRLLLDLKEQLFTTSLMPAGISRHAKLVGILIDAGQLLQGIADAGWPACEISRFVHALARCVVRSFDAGLEVLGTLPEVPEPVLPRSVELRVPEGFAFYAVYPEAYIEAARQLKLAGAPKVIGIRSIGASLGAVVAAAIGASEAVTVRPRGNPFSRVVELPAGLIEAGAHYIIVDEGPGLSGSSFGAVADQLEAAGVPLERIAFLPSHQGDLGPQASDAHRLRWNSAQRVAAVSEPSFLCECFGPLQQFTAGGAWQRSKFLGAVEGVPILVKFEGLGRIGERKLEMARALHSTGFTPEPIGFVHGFIAERWFSDATPLHERDRPVEEIGRYVGARARLFPAPQQAGASVEQLLQMCRRNIGLALGDDAAARVDRFAGLSHSLEVRRVRTDNKMQPEEWLRSTGGRLLKTDALDHHQAHDLIGCQSFEWDLAGAIEEFAFDARDISRLLAATGLEPDLALLGFYQVAYAAFRLGQSELGGDGAGVQKYRRSIQHLLLQNS